jgi:hypothetical protein
MESAGDGGEARPVLLPPVQELAGQLGAADDVPARYVACAGAGNDDRKATVTAPVPVIDLARLCQPGGDGADDEAQGFGFVLEKNLVRTELDEFRENSDEFRTEFGEFLECEA